MNQVQDLYRELLTIKINNKLWKGTHSLESSAALKNFFIVIQLQLSIEEFFNIF